MANPYAPPGEPRPQEQPPTTSGSQPGAGQPPSAPPVGGGPYPGGSYPGGAQGWPSPAPPQQGGPPQGGPQQGWPQHGGPRPGGSHAHRDPRRPQPPAPDSEIARATSRRVLHFLAFLLAAVVTSALPLPWQAAALVFVVAAIVVGIRAVVLAWRGGIRGGLVVMLTVGVAMAGFVGLGMLSLLALWPQQVRHQECLARAVTISANRACDVEYQRAVNERLGIDSSDS